jgi:phospholipid/cholesterol/gamma-HCH transport system permease protein
MRIGEQTLEVLSDVRALLVFAGEVVLGVGEALRKPRRIRWRETWLYMERTGLDAVPIVSLISFLMGLITAFQAAVQLTQFGADIYVANLVGLSIVRELGPLMTAIIAAGRSGAAFAAEIGTMKVSDEVDALTTMGLDRTRFLVTPKVLALLVMLPCLTLGADLVGILGGLTVAVVGLGLPVQVYVRQTRIALGIWDVYSGLIKSVAFAILIAGVGCLRGFQAEGGAESVGRITTSAIVAAIFLIIVADAVFTVIFHYW